MKQRGRTRGLSLLLALVLAVSLALPVRAAGTDVEKAAALTGAYVYKTVKAPQVGSIGGEWVVLGLARSGYEAPERYYQDYYAGVEKYVKDCGGVLHEQKYTEYSRVIVALSAIGKDARNVAGYDLTLALGDYDKTIWQGLNGPIWALIALDSADYPMPENPAAKTQATRQMYVDRILECRLPDGGWSLFGGTAAASSSDGISDPDITGMALQALAKYQSQPAVAKAIQEALACMSKRQDAEGGFSSWGAKNTESCVQMIVALCELGLSLEDGRFVKNGHSLLDGLMAFAQSDGSFRHTTDGSGENLMATEQALYALAAVRRAQSGQRSLYRMSDALSLSEAPAGPAENENRHPDVRPPAVTRPDTVFGDVPAGHPGHDAVEAMAAREIINGKAEGVFDPEAPVTRAQFAVMMVRTLGLTPQAKGTFSDVPAEAWYAPYVDTAAAYGLISGVGGGRFNPTGNISRQAAAIIAARAAKLCGLNTELDASAVRDVLAQFSDYTKTSEQARQALAFCYGQGIWDSSALEIQGTMPLKRWETAQTLYGVLRTAGLL